MGPLRYQSTTGLAADQIEELVERIWQIVQPSQKRGRTPGLGLYRQVVLTLILIRQNLNQMTVGDMFDISQPTVSRIYRKILPLIGQALCLHEPDLAEAIRGLLVLVDGTLVPTGNRAGHDDNYSGKRRRAGLNIQVLSNTDGNLLAVSRPCHGSIHDRAAWTDTGWEELLADRDVIGDLGYLGTAVITPRRKPKGGELSARDKTCNREISALRSAAERAIAHLKNWKILATGYRGRLAELPKVLRIITALEFYRIGW